MFFARFQISVTNISDLIFETTFIDLLEIFQNIVLRQIPESDAQFFNRIEIVKIMKFISLFKCKFEGKIVDSFPLSNGEAELVSFCQLVYLCGFKSWKWISTTFNENLFHSNICKYPYISLPDASIYQEITNRPLENIALSYS